MVVFRDCFMNCLEAIYQLRDATEYIVATQALAPAVGTWPWKAFMASLTPDASAYEAGLGLAKALGGLPRRSGSIARASTPCRTR